MVDEIAKIAVEEFERKPDGSWVCVKNSDVITNTQKVIRVTPGMMFKKGGKLWGVDVAEALEKMSAMPKN